MVLVDTSVWIEAFRKSRPLRIESVVDPDDIVTCLFVIQEVLQGFRDEAAFRTAREAMFSFPVLDSPVPRSVFEDAAALYRSARRAGVTVRSSVDCLIAATAIRNQVEVLHRDRDFPAIARISSLRTRSV